MGESKRHKRERDASLTPFETCIEKTVCIFLVLKQQKVMGYKLLLPFLLQQAEATVTPKCLIIEQAENGWKSLTSPDYPKKFSPHTQCIYRLSAPEGERIEIEFVDFLLFNNDAEECAQQGLSIRDPESSTTVGKYCGNTKPPNYTTIGEVGSYKNAADRWRITPLFSNPKLKWNRIEQIDNTRGQRPTVLTGFNWLLFYTNLNVTIQ